MKQVKKDTLARTLALLVALVNQVLAVSGREALPFGEEPVYQFVTLGITLTTSLVAWWKNNSFTKAAMAGDVFLACYRKQCKKEKEADSCE